MAVTLFAIVVALGIGAAVVLTRRAMPHTRTRRGPIPGYSFTPGSEVDVRRLPGDPNAYDVLSLEEFHAPDRTRLVLTLESDQPQLDHDLRVIAVALQGQSHANVVLVERLTTGGKKRAHLFAPDGLGWSGAASPIHIES